MRDDDSNSDMGYEQSKKFTEYFMHKNNLSAKIDNSQRKKTLAGLFAVAGLGKYLKHSNEQPIEPIDKETPIIKQSGVLLVDEKLGSLNEENGFTPS